MADEMEQELKRILAEDESHDNRIEQLQHLDKTATELLQVTKIAHPLCNGELDEILEQANHDDMCMRALSKLLKTNGHENSGRNASMPQNENVPSTSSQETFRNAFQMLQQGNIDKDSQLPQLAFDAVQAAEERRRRESAADGTEAAHSSQGQPAPRLVVIYG
ncbi:hypothetical protein ANCCAN_30658 [Ancylostoma caninum]|uniref:Uncharacterized protein n=1 Tax=Ancylostoma caninum TaxID=29170 RepID=A0A368EY99_ANCCA|nr:hypothetical protein ANCCAN_30658 [Ancylostoma caninum]